MIKTNSVVGISYVLKNVEGQELDRADAKNPLVYLHGSGQIVPGLEKELNGLDIGDKKEVSVSPAEGYGEENPQLKLKTDPSIFPQDVEVKLGMEFSADIGDGKTHHFSVTRIEGSEVFIDGNHPLAGQTLNFSIEVVSIRDATKEELSHGHAHGPGGHAH